MNFVYGIGAAVVIVGALFKILHLKGADLMLSVGLLTEAGIFVISAFEPVHMDPDWSLVYPELAGGEPTDKKINWQRFSAVGFYVGTSQNWSRID